MKSFAFHLLRFVCTLRAENALQRNRRWSPFSLCARPNSLRIARKNRHGAEGGPPFLGALFVYKVRAHDPQTNKKGIEKGGTPTHEKTAGEQPRQTNETPRTNARRHRKSGRSAGHVPRSPPENKREISRRSPEISMFSL